MCTFGETISIRWLLSKCLTEEKRVNNQKIYSQKRYEWQNVPLEKWIFCCILMGTIWKSMVRTEFERPCIQYMVSSCVSPSSHCQALASFFFLFCVYKFHSEIWKETNLWISSQVSESVMNPAKTGKVYAHRCRRRRRRRCRRRRRRCSCCYCCRRFFFLLQNAFALNELCVEDIFRSKKRQMSKERVS